MVPPVWIDATQAVDDIQEQINDLLANSPEDDAQKAIKENYCGCYASLADYAEELTEETTQTSEHLAFHIDYEKMGHDMELSGDVFTIETGYQEVYIFWNH